jgi:predicted outer membrane repeat protein
LIDPNPQDWAEQQVEGSLMLRTTLRRFSNRREWNRRLKLRPLEERAVPTLFTVTLPGDAGVFDPMDPSKGDLRYCISKINSNMGDDTIVFDPSITSVSLNSQLDITDPAGLLIDGNGTVTIMNVAAAGPTSRLFDITAITASEIEFRGLTLTGGLQTIGGGGAIQTANTNLRLTNCVFNNNKATTSAGGAVSALTASTVINISGCTFTNNSAATTGGALQVVGASSTITIDGTIFSGNSNSGTTGGAINIQNTATLNIGVASGCTFANNSAKTNGGALNTAGSTTATINNSTFSGNSAAGTGTGGGINFNTATNVTFTNSKITNNTAGGAGGGMRFVTSTATVTFNTCTISGNVTNATSGGGGGVSMSGGSFKAYYSTFSGNTANVTGGGLYATTATITFTNCTISGNEAVGNSTVANGGGGINLSSGLLNVNNSTIVGNKVSGSATTSIGGGIRKSLAAGAVTIHSTVIANNTAASGVGAELGGSVAITVNGNDNLLGSGLLHNFSFVNGPIIADPRLASFGNYGGPTQTYGFRYNSPLIDQGNLFGIGSFTNDQRGSGFPRSIDNPGVVNGPSGFTDIGAVEGNLTIPWADTVTGIADVTMPTAAPYTFTVIYDDETGINPVSLNTGEIKVAGPGGFLNFTPSVTGTTAGPGPNQTTVTYSFNPPVGGWQLIHGGNYTVNLLPNKVFDNDTPTAQSAQAQLLGSFRVSLPGAMALVVDNAGDAIDGDYSAGNLTLREALALANAATGGVDTITFAAGLHGQTITAGQGEMRIEGPTQINGPGAALLTLSGNNTNRIFNISDGTASIIDVAIRGVTLTGGRSANGGAISMAAENLLIENAIVTANTSTGLGGAIWFSTAGATLTINNSTVSNNTATNNGGAIGTSGGSNTIAFNNSTFTGNKSSISGGVIDAGGGGGELNVTNSTFTGNSASSNGGAISSGYVVYNFVNCTLSGNSAGGAGGAVAGFNNFQKFTNCTFFGNTAGSGGGAITTTNATGTASRIVLTSCTVVDNRTTSGSGGGVRLVTTSTGVNVFLRVINSVVSGNGVGASLPGTPSDLFRGGTAPNNVADVNFSAVGTTSGVTLSGTSGNNLVGAFLDLGPLQNNGGPTPTMLPNPGSPLIDAGDNTVAMLTTDQRGFTRPVDIAGVPNVGDGTDIGAVEVQSGVVTPPPTVNTILINNGDVQRSLVTSIKVTFSEAVMFPAGIANAFVVERIALGGPLGNVAFDALQTGSDVVITFKSGGTVDVDPGKSLPDGQYKLTIVADNVVGVGGKLDGNGDMMAQGSPTDDKIATFHRLFGDANGDGAVTATDFNVFRLAYGGGPSIFDFDNDGNTSASDFNQFRLRYGSTGFLP